MTRLGLISIAAVVVGCQGPAPERFDLVCDTQTTHVSDSESRVTENQRVRYSLDLKAKTWCSEVLSTDSPIRLAGCSKGRFNDISSVSGTEIGLLHGSNLYLTVDRGTGEIHGQMADLGDPTGRYLTRGTCRKAHFTPQAKAKF